MRSRCDSGVDSPCVTGAVRDRCGAGPVRCVAAMSSRDHGNTAKTAGSIAIGSRPDTAVPHLERWGASVVSRVRVSRATDGSVRLRRHVRGVRARRHAGETR